LHKTRIAPRIGRPAVLETKVYLAAEPPPFG